MTTDQKKNKTNRKTKTSEERILKESIQRKKRRKNPQTDLGITRL